MNKKYSVSACATCTFIIIAFSVAVASAQQTPAAAAAADRVPLEQRLAVVADITGQTYCHVDPDSFSVKLAIKLRFTNLSDRPLILARMIKDPPSVRVAKSTRDVQNGNFEYNPITDYFPTELPPAPKFGDTPGTEYFVTLLPKESYESTVTSVVIGAQDAAKRREGSGLLSKGPHV